MDVISLMAEFQELKVEKKPWMHEVTMELVTWQTLPRVVQECIDAGFYACDLETTGLDNRVFNGSTVDRIVGVCLSPDGIRGYYVPLRHRIKKPGGTYDNSPHNIPSSMARKEFKKLFSSGSVAIFHNAKFDQEFLAFNGGDSWGDWDDIHTWEDTLILAYLEDTRQKSVGLKGLSKSVLDKEMIQIKELFPEDHKGPLDFSILDPTDETTVWYAAGDAICTYGLFLYFAPRVVRADDDRYAKIKHKFIYPKEPKKTCTQGLIYQIEKGCLLATRWMERNRIHTDRDLIRELICIGQKEYVDAIFELYDSVSIVLGRNIMPNFFSVWKEKLELNDPDNSIMDQMDRARVEAKRLYPDPTDLVSKNNKKYPYIYDVQSAQQLGLMFEEMAVPGLNFTDKSGQVKTSKDEIDRIVEDAGEGFSFMKQVKKFREVQKALSTYLFPLYEDADPTDHTIRINFNGHRVDTGRFCTPGKKKNVSDGGYLHGGTRYNLQSTPSTYDPNRPECMRRIRQCFKAPDGYVFVACVAEGTLIPCDRGILPIEEIQPSDKVWTMEGWSEVSWAGCTGKKPVFKLCTEKGYELRLTEDHKVLTTGNDGFVWKELRDLHPGDWIVQKSSFLGSQIPALPSATRNHFNEIDVDTPALLTRDLAQFLGHLMGDGYIGHKNDNPVHVGMSLGNDCEELLPVINSLVRDLNTITFKEKDRGDVICHSTIFARWLNSITKKGDLSVHEYEVPKIILESPPRMVSAFLRGFFDADGSVGKRGGDGISLWITSDAMASQVQLLLLGLGILANKKYVERDTNYGHQTGYRLTITGIQNLILFNERVGFQTLRKKQRLLNLLELGRNRDITNFVPVELATKAVVRQRHPETNCIHTNGKRRGRVSFEALQKAATHSEDIDFEWMDGLLDGTLFFDQIESITPDGSANVYDLTVPQQRQFLASGIIVHNCDYAGVELRVVTNMSHEPLWLKEFFRCGDCGHSFDKKELPPQFCPSCGSDKIGDLHSLSAYSFYGKDAKDRDDWKKLRGDAKQCNFALCYGGGPNAVMNSIHCAQAEAYRIKNLFDKTYRGLCSWWSRQHQFARENGYIQTAFGRKYPLPDINHENGFFRSKAERNATNGPVQGTSADITKIAMWRIYRRFLEKGWLDRARMIITMHDELCFVIEKEILEEALEIIKFEMTQNKAIQSKFDAKQWFVPLVIDIEMGLSWDVPWDLNKLKKKGNWPEELRPYFKSALLAQERISQGLSPVEETISKTAGLKKFVYTLKDRLTVENAKKIAGAISKSYLPGGKALSIFGSNGVKLGSWELPIDENKFLSLMEKQS